VEAGVMTLFLAFKVGIVLFKQAVIFAEPMRGDVLPRPNRRTT
jgi:hypothetical protein